MNRRTTTDEYQIQGYYCFEWEVITSETNRRDALALLIDYRANEPNTLFKVVKKRVKKQKISSF